MDILGVIGAIFSILGYFLSRNRNSAAKLHEREMREFENDRNRIAEELAEEQRVRLHIQNVMDARKVARREAKLRGELSSVATSLSDATSRRRDARFGSVGSAFLMVLGLVVVAAVVLMDDDDVTDDRQDSVLPTASSTTAMPDPVSTDEAENLLLSYFSAAGAGDYEGAWSLLSPRYQRAYGGFGAFRSFWEGVDLVGPSDLEVKVVDEGTPFRLVFSARVFFELSDGQRSDEIVTVTVVRTADNSLLIDAYEARNV